MSRVYGPTFRWFAWHPARTEDRGWRWLRMLYRRRYSTAHGHPSGPIYGFADVVGPPPGWKQPLLIGDPILRFGTCYDGCHGFNNHHRDCAWHVPYRPSREDRT